MDFRVFRQTPISHLNCFHSLCKGPLLIYVSFHRLFTATTSAPSPIAPSLSSFSFTFLKAVCLHGFYMLYTFHTGSLFSFTYFFYMFDTGPLFSFTCFFTCFIQAPFFHLHGFNMFYIFHLHGFYRVSNIAFQDFL